MNKQRLNGRKCANETTVSLDGTSYTCSVDRAFQRGFGEAEKGAGKITAAAPREEKYFCRQECQ
jgi:hypothetical protein